MKKSELVQAVREEIRALKIQKEGEDHEVSMAIGQLEDIIKNAGELMYKIGPDEKDIPGWIQDHISQAQNFINQANTGYHELGDSQPDPTQLALETIKKVDNKYAVYPEKGGKRLGTHSTKAAAQKQLTAIHLNKEEKKKGVDGKACWDGYRYGGTKDGKDICIKIK